MAHRLSDLRRGRIIWAILRDHNGFAKNRPAIIITRTEDIDLHAALEVMAITTSFPSPALANHIELPWHPQGKTRTRLRRRSAAVVNWLDEVNTDEILELQGDVPPALMLQILERLDQLQ